jgi:hypothetical protein
MQTTLPYPVACRCMMPLLSSECQSAPAKIHVTFTAYVVPSIVAIGNKAFPTLQLSVSDTRSDGWVELDSVQIAHNVCSCETMMYSFIPQNCLPSIPARSSSDQVQPYIFPVRPSISSLSMPLMSEPARSPSSPLAPLSDRYRVPSDPPRSTSRSWRRILRLDPSSPASA